MEASKDVRNAALVAVALFAATALALIGLASYRRPPVALARGARLLIADFECPDGDVELAAKLKQILALSLDQSALFGIYPESRIRDSAREIAGRPRSTITGDLALQICARDAIPAFLLPRIFRVGNSAVVSIRIIEVQNDFMREAAGGTVSAHNPEILLCAMDDLAKQVRQSLGERLPPPESLSASNSPVKTTRADALDLFAQALVQREKNDYAGQIVMLKEAIELDPQFAAAHMQLASAYGSIGDVHSAGKHLAMAREHADRLPPKEQYGILGAYHLLRCQYPEAVLQFNALAKLYPNDWRTRSYLADAALALREYPRAVEEYKRALALDDSQIHCLLGLCMAHLMNRDAVMARRAWDRANASEPQNPEVLITGGMLDLVDNNVSAAAQAFQALRSSTLASLRSRACFLIAQAQIYCGRIEAALSTLEEGMEEDKRDLDRFEEADKRLAMTGIYQIMGQAEKALDQCRRLEGLPMDDVRYLRLGIWYARLGHPDEAQGVFKKLKSVDATPLSRLYHQILLGEIALASGDQKGAIQILLRAKSLPLGSAPSEPLARAFASAGQWPEAEKEYVYFCEQKAEMLFPVHLPWFTGTWTRALFDAAKCQLMLNHNSDAQQSLRNYLWVMDGADPGLATVEEAKLLLKNNRGR